MSNNKIALIVFISWLCCSAEQPSVHVNAAFHPSSTLGTTTTSGGTTTVPSKVLRPLRLDTTFPLAASIGNGSLPRGVGDSSTSNNNSTIRSGSTASSLVNHQRAVVAGVTFNVVKAMLGTGMLALPMGVAVASNYPSALIPASLLLQGLAILSAYTFAIYGRLAHTMPNAQSLGEIWRILGQTNGDQRDTSFIISFANFMFCFGSCLAFSLILGDTLSSLAKGMLIPTTTTATNGAAILPAWFMSRQTAILAVTIPILFPLCQLKSLTALAPISIVGVMGALITVGFLGYRCPAVVTSSPYNPSTGGIWAATTSGTAVSSAFGTYSRIASIAPLTLVSMSCIALMAHFSAIEFYQALLLPSLRRPKPPNGSSRVVTTKTPTATITTTTLRPSNADSLVLRQFLIMTLVSFAVTALVSNLSMAFGFLTFGSACSGNILNNYHVNDGGAIFSRLLCGLSLIGSYPMCLRPCSAAALELLKIPLNATNTRRMTTVLLTILTSIALSIQNVGFVISLNGAIMGSSLVYTVPCLLFLKLTNPNKTKNTKAIDIGSATRWLKLERAFCRLLIVFGVTAMVAGTGTAIISSFYPHLLR